MKIGIVGHEAKKFGPQAEQEARATIRSILYEAAVENFTGLPEIIVVSGHCHLGGIDIWAGEEAANLGLETDIYPPKYLDWSRGYKPRNLLIAKNSDIVHCIVVDRLPRDYEGMRFKSCYHCGTDTHVKSGGCWTAKRAKKAVWHIVKQDG